MNSKPQKRKFDKLAFIKKDVLAKKKKQVIHVASAKLTDLEEKLVEYPSWGDIDHEVAEYKIVKQRGFDNYNPKCVLRGSKGKAVMFTTPVLAVIEEATGPHGNMGKYESTKTLNKAKKTITVAPIDQEGNLFMKWIHDVEKEHCEAACNMEGAKGNSAWEKAISARDSEEEVWKGQNKLLKDVIIEKKRKKMFTAKRPATKWAPADEEAPELPLLYWRQKYKHATPKWAPEWGGEKKYSMAAHDALLKKYKNNIPNTQYTTITRVNEWRTDIEELEKTWFPWDAVDRLVPGAHIQLRVSLRAYCVNENMYGVSCDFDRDVIVHSMPEPTGSTIPIIL